MSNTGITSRKDWQGLALPFILMITGAVLFAGGELGFLSLDRMQNLWPMAVILVGLADLMPERPESIH